ncbi:MAG TPA: hypothetical protein VGL72_15665 [Bryobacteraceae bacterium]|jgi:hypothetical protein
MGVSEEEIHAQLERLLSSKSFETSEAHRRLLQYLAGKTIAGEADRLKEYTIGLEAFGKPSTYDPKHDSIVRLQASRLRQKLNTYYQTEANGDPVLVSLPKGAFKLIFEPRPEARAETLSEPPPDAALELTPSPQTDPDVSLPPNRRFRLIHVLLAVALLWAIIATVAYLRLRTTPPAGAAEAWNADLESLWSPFLKSERPLLVCLGTPLFVRVPDLGFFRDPKVNDWPEIQKSERFQRFLKAAQNPEVVAAYPFTGTGEAGAAVLISRLLSSRKRDVLLTRSNILSWQQIMDDDVVFVGPPKFNPQLQSAALTQDVVMEAEGIRNRKPQSGEPAFLEDHMIPGKPSEGETHALITLMPGPSGAGALLMLAGNASPDTLAAAEWLTQARRASDLVNRIRKNSGEMPKYFQVVLKVSFKQSIPVESSYVFHHVLTTTRTP